MADRYDLVVVGAGPGGYVAAIRAAQLGKKVACVDKREALGGTCLNVGCIPSKALLDSSEYYWLARSRFTVHGIEAGDVRLNLQKMMERKDRVVKGLTDGVAFLLKKNHITHVQGTARLAGSNRVAVDSAEPRPQGSGLVLESPAILLATGSEPIPLPSAPFDGSTVVDSTGALAFARVPDHLIVIGGSYIGLEIGSIWARLGAKVSVIEMLPRLAGTMDAEVAEQLRRALVKRGLEFRLDTKVLSAQAQGGRVLVTTQHRGEEATLEGDKLLVAVGRRPFLRDLTLTEAGVLVDEKSGRVPVNESFQTNVPGIYAIGDLVAGPMLAHKAQEEGIAFAERLAGMKTRVNYDAIPGIIYTSPEVAAVGLTEDELKQSGRQYRVGRFPFAANGRARCLDEIEGFVKILSDAGSDRVLGVHIIGPRASELIVEAVTVLEFAGSAEDIARICHAHPTLSEAMHEAALALDGRAIHA
jgi:dihydrolipoamide dehydrogenase